jgi:hypothetical protein
MKPSTKTPLRCSVRTVDEFRTDVKLVLDKELTLAKTLIAALSKPFEPGKLKNESPFG